MPYAFFLLLVFASLCFSQSHVGTVDGKIINKSTGEPLSGCSITAEPEGIGTSSDSAGSFSLIVPYGTHKLTFSFVGFETAFRSPTLSSSHDHVRLKVSLLPKVLSLGEFTITGSEETAPPSVQKIEEQDLHRMPTIYSDVLRSVQILPGISSNNELSSAYNVRGGNFDENLIYLNGYEVYRPFLLRQGIEENQSLVNPDMADGVRFYNGAFPANFGDKMSSVLEVSYKHDQPANWGGVVRADLLNQGLSVHNRSGNLNWSLGARYSNPNIFVNTLQTSGTYRPQFRDLQLLANYNLPAHSRIELFFLTADNQFRLTPKSWSGHFLGSSYADVKAVELRYDGKREYSYKTGLLGLRYEKAFAQKSYFAFSAARYNTTEKEDADVVSNIYYNESAFFNDVPLQYLKKRIENDHDRLDLTTYEFQPAIQYAHSIHTLQAGLNLRLVKMDSRVDELFHEVGDSSIQEQPRITKSSQNLSLNSYSGYVQDIINFNEYYRADLGVRLLRYDYSKETLLSPRIGLHYFFDINNTFNLSWGYYDQPPFFHEVVSRSDSGTSRLKSQQAMHYVLGWEHEFKRDLTLEIETYYKKLDHVIPFYLDQMKLIYGDQNSLKGYAYGFDVLLRGQVTKDINSWISYGYLNTREKTVGGNSPYERRLLDQTHTLRFFLQDKMPALPNVQVHNRMLFGTGYLYYPEKVVTDDQGNKSLAVDFDHRFTYPFYFRADIGFSARLKLGKRSEMIIIAEVLNAFNRANVASYSWFPVYPSDPSPVKVPQVLSDRFFNLGVELRLN